MSGSPGGPDLLLGSLTLRPYVFVFLAAHLVAAAAAWGPRGAMTFTLLAASLAFGAEWLSTRVGWPFGLYHYTGLTRGQELYLDNVPFFDPLSFAFLAFASLGVARLLVAPIAARRPWAGRPGPLALLTGLLMTWLDVVIDPLAVRGDRWFLGRIFYYPEPGWYFGVPMANFGGWLVLGTAIVGLWLLGERRLAGPVPDWAAPRPVLRAGPLVLYYGVLAFNLALTAWVGEPALFWSGVALHAPLLALVVSSLAGRGGFRA